ncbi:thioesterase family protein [Nonomuraea mangrovi]|uniref:Thioesterase family protein n=1 Tax=Nonomuraea mangrovi TaxID=2316207 RepID=A0ABW4TDS4_9ACTN
MTTFRDATAVAPRADGGFDATLDEKWSVGDKAHGGYLLAVMGRAAIESAGQDHPHLTAVSGSFISPPSFGAVRIDVETLRRGKAVTQVRARMSQNDAPLVEALITLGRLTEDDPWWSGLEPVELPDEQECWLSPTEPPGAGMRVPLMEVVEQRLNPAHLAFAFGEPARQGVIAGWQRLADGSDWDPLSLLVAMDPVPPVSFDLGAPGWVPTIQLSAYIRRLPAPGPLRVRLTASDVTAERMDETAHAWDAKGRLVAQATQLAAVRTPAQP